MASQLLASTDLLNWRRHQLQRGGRAADLDWLLDLGAGVSRSVLQRLLLDPEGEETVPVQKSLSKLEKLWLRHLEYSQPLQHLVGVCPWRDLLLEVSHAALIPRQETEILVDLALAHAVKRPPRCWADLGTGSGAIAVSLCRAWPHSEGHAVDLSSGALSLAKRNLQALAPQHKCRIHRGSWWTPLRPSWGQIEMVISNPPYIPQPLMSGLDPVVRDHEPHIALVGGEDGLDAIRSLLADAPRALAPNGVLLLEHHYDQSERVRNLMLASGLVNVTAASDLEGVLRFALGQRDSRSVP
ncbi:peptide chain release factor N(5)-glutamine methyltransferase [Synechococcus sp. M16CYN]|uniref:peptide chain release factor N(5)-glutamine methyltransferase n=1 Tax=Synechococcus sp. M16CYN TaxID=3103139 RepID=UPI003342B79F